MSPRLFPVLVLCGALSAVVLAQPPDGPGGLDEFRVDSEHPTYNRADISMDARGNFVVVWPSNPLLGGEGSGLYARRYSSDGEPLTGDLRLGPNGSMARVASAGDGSFVVTWDVREGPSEARHRVRRFSGAGEPLTEELLFDSLRHVASAPGGSFLLVWDAPDGSETGVFARLFSRQGQPLTGEIQVNVHTASWQSASSVASDGQGNFVVAWHSSEQDGDSLGVFARLLASDGNFFTGELQLHTVTAGTQWQAAVAGDAGGGFVAVWNSRRDGRWEFGVAARRFASDGGALTEEIEVFEGEISPTAPVVRAADDGSFLIAWPMAFEFVGGYFGQHFDRGGRRLGGTFRVQPRIFDWAGQLRLAGGIGGDYVALYSGPEHLLARRLPADGRAGTLGFASPDLELAEVDGTRELLVLRSGGALGEVSVDVFTDEGSAAADEDFRQAASRLTFSEEDSLLRQAFAVEIRDDDLIEDDETFVLRLSNPDGGARLLEGRSQREIRILNQDYNPPELLPVALGDETVVARSGERYSSVWVRDVALSPAGDAAVLWAVSHDGLFVKFYDDKGQERGGALRLSDSFGRVSTLAFDGDSGFLALWVDPGKQRIKGRRFSLRGNGRGRFQAAACDAQRHCVSELRMAGGSGGRIPAAWVAGGDLYRVMIEPDDQMSVAAVAESSVNPSIAAAAGGTFIISWRADRRFLADRFDAQGEAEGKVFWLQSESPSLDLALADDRQLFTVFGDKLQRFRADGRRAGQPTAFADFPYGLQVCPTVAGDGRGNFVVAWQQSGQPGPAADGDATSVLAKRYNRTWGPVGGELRVNLTTKGIQTCPILEVGADGGFAVAYTSAAAAGSEVLLRRFAPTLCSPGGGTLCLMDDRYRLELRWRDGKGKTGRGHAATLTDNTGYFWFFGPENVEVVVKVLDGRKVNGNYWVFYGSLTNVEYTMTVTDTMTGEVREFQNPQGTFASVADNEAFPGDELGWKVAASPDVEPPPVAAGPSKDGCAADETHLCLNGGRFELAMTWRDFKDRTGTGRAVPLTGDAGYFWFFGPKNVEVVVKVLDGRDVNGHFWIFYGALSNVEYTLTVRDTVTGNVREYHNPLFGLASVGDTEALPGG